MNQFFNEDSLKDEILKIWGPAGAHIDVYRELLKRKRIVDEANKASNLFMGSEYFNDPAYIIREAEKRINSQLDTILKKVKEIKKLKHDIKNKEQVITSLRDVKNKNV